MVKWYVGLNILSTVVLIVLCVALATGNAKLDVPSGKTTVAEENSNIQDKFFITKELANILDEKYANSDVEFAACLNMNQVVKMAQMSLQASYMITGLDSDILSFGASFSTMGYCNSGVIHSHPKETCKFSLADIYSFKDRIKKGELYSIIMCGKDTFYYITRNDFTEQKLEIKETS
jgi:hypothetical protein